MHCEPFYLLGSHLVFFFFFRLRLIKNVSFVSMWALINWEEQDVPA